MNCNHPLKKGILLLAIFVSSLSLAQQKPASGFTDQELKNAGWTQQQIDELRESTQESTRESEADAGTNAQPDKSRVGYSSVFESYVPFDYLPEIEWREANDKVGEIGGWKTYLRMVQEAAESASDGDEDRKQ